MSGVHGSPRPAESRTSSGCLAQSELAFKLSGSSLCGTVVASSAPDLTPGGDEVNVVIPVTHGDTGVLRESHRFRELLRGRRPPAIGEDGTEPGLVDT